MYELACPSCGVKRATPFVRLGAVTQCDACAHTYRIAGPHVSRVQAAVTASVTPADGVLLADPPPPEDPSAGSSITGLSGLSQLMDAEPLSPTVGGGTGILAMNGPDAPVPSSPAEDLRRGLSQVPEVNAEGRTRSDALHRRAVKLNRQRRSRRTWFVVVASLAILVGLIGVGLLILYSVSGDQPGEIPRPPAEAAVTPAPSDADTPPPGQPR